MACGLGVSDPSFVRVGGRPVHSRCFACADCGCALRPGHFRLSSGGALYCPAHFGERFCRPCEGCGERITEGSLVRACGASFHPRCFRCARDGCGAPLDTASFYLSRDGRRPLCVAHAVPGSPPPTPPSADNAPPSASPSPSPPPACPTCGRAGGTVRVPGVAAPFHAACLECHLCGRALDPAALLVRGARLYCRRDFDAVHARLCGECGAPVEGRCVEAAGVAYHPACLACAACGERLAELRRGPDGSLLCAGHAARKPPPPEAGAAEAECGGGCGRPLAGSAVVVACGVRTHRECLRCRACARPLTAAEARLDAAAGGLVCLACVRKPRRSAAVLADPAGTGLPAGIAPVAPPPPQQQQQQQQPKAKPPQPRRPPALVVPSARAAPKGAAAAPGTAPPPRTPPAAGALLAPPGRSVPSTPRRASDGGTRLASAAASAPSGRIEWQRGALIGRGAFGKVFMAMNTETGELLAVKQVDLPPGDEGEERAATLEQEIGLMARLRHPNVVALLGTERVGRKLNILLEYVPGNSVDALLAKFGPFSERVVRNYTAQLLFALRYCHECSVVHRDVKGKNVLVNTRGELKLADFGSAKLVASVVGKDAPSIGFNYTPLWTAPEVLRGNYNAKIDVWSLGCVIVEMASGATPWAEMEFENPFRALYHIGNSDATPAVPASLSPAARAFCARCLTRDPDLRPTAAELLEDDWITMCPTPDPPGSPRAPMRPAPSTPRGPPLAKGFVGRLCAVLVCVLSRAVES